MFDQITDGVHFVTALILSVIIWGLCLAWRGFTISVRRGVTHGIITHWLILWI